MIGIFMVEHFHLCSHVYPCYHGLVMSGDRTNCKSAVPFLGWSKLGRSRGVLRGTAGRRPSVRERGEEVRESRVGRTFGWP